MVKKRVAAVVLVRDGIVVQSIGFRRHLPIGRPAIALEFLSRWGIDEIVLLDIGASAAGRGPDFAMVTRACAACLVPVAAGGGITSVEQMRELLHCGADKIVLNRSLLLHPALVSEGAAEFGNQCIVAAIDAVMHEGSYAVYDHVDRTALGIGPAELAVRAQELGAGELFINSVDRDGSYQGYDAALIEEVCAVAQVPVIACGGARNGHDVIELLRSSPVSAAAAANFFHFTEHSVNVTKALAGDRDLIRMETLADYAGANIGADMRLGKQDEARLQELLYVPDEVEII